MVTKIKVPESLTLRSSIEFCKKLQNLPQDDEYSFDFRKTKFVEPYGMLLTSSEIQQFRERSNDNIGMYCENYKQMTYAGHMGFFKAFGLDYGKVPGEAHGSKNYIPLTILNVDEIEKNAADADREIGDEVEEQSSILTETLIGDSEGDVFETLAYSIREIIRNVIEHSRAKQIGLCAQFWPSKGSAELAILDRGCGLKSSLSANPHIDASTDKSSINYALMPAVSGVAFKGAKKRNKGSPWANSGFGLYMTNRICRNGGNFFICSGDTGMILTSSGEGKRYFETCFKGTAVRLTIKTANLESLKDALERYRTEGYEIQKMYREIVNIDPSSASLMLSEDFNLSLWKKLLAKVKKKSSLI